MTVFHYVIVRQDIPHGSRYALIGHAAGESASGAPKLPDTARVCVLGVANEWELREVELRLLAAGVAVSSIREDEGGFAGQMMAVGVDPWASREVVRPILAHLGTLK